MSSFRASTPVSTAFMRAGTFINTGQFDVNRGALIAALESAQYAVRQLQQLAIHVAAHNSPLWPG